jgi:small subunit ribosomal protein S1
MEKDPVSNFIAEHSKGSVVKAIVSEVDAKGAVMDLGDGVEGYLRASELSQDRVEDARTVLNVGDEIEAKFLGMDRKNRTINLSIKAKDTDIEKAAISDYKRGSAPATTTLGDLLKEQMDDSE